MGKTKIPNSKIPVVILNGFLGSGKTTLFRSLLAQCRKERIAVCAVVNDMSELDVDGELIANTEIVEEDDSIYESIHSCVLSSKLGIKKLDEAIHKLLSKHDPEIFIIETSGSCHPLPLIQYFEKHTRLKLTGVLALVDSVMLAHDYNYGQEVVPLMQHNLQHQQRDMINLLVEQILFCSHLILTKLDRIEQDRVPDIVKSIQTINPYVSILSVVFGNYPIEKLMETPEYDYHRVAVLAEELKPVMESEARGDRPYNMATRVIDDDRPFHPQRLWDVCHQYLDKRIYRSKGFFWMASRDKISLLWNQAAGSINLEFIGYWRSGIVEENNSGLLEFEIEELKKRLVNEKGRFGDRQCHLTIIGDEMQVDRFTDALRSCFLTEEEIERWKEGGDFVDPWPKNLLKIRN